MKFEILLIRQQLLQLITRISFTISFWPIRVNQVYTMLYCHNPDLRIIKCNIVYYILSSIYSGFIMTWPMCSVFNVFFVYSLLYITTVMDTTIVMSIVAITQISMLWQFDIIKSPNPSLKLYLVEKPVCASLSRQQ